MKLSSFLPIVCGSALIVSPVIVTAGGHGHGDHDHHHEQKAHVHGVAELSIAQEGNKIEIHLDSPAMNILGFEHTPKTEAQKEQVLAAKKVLGDTQDLFQFKGAECQLTEAELESPLFEYPKGHAHDDHDDHHHGHEHKHDHDHKHHHADHDKGDKHKDTHSEIEAKYEFACDNAGQTQAIYIGLLEQFPGIENLQVYWVTEEKQGAAELTNSERWVNIR